MISRHVKHTIKDDNYKRLAEYIIAANNDVNKNLFSWCECCYSGDDFELAIQEILNTQSMNTRSQKEKTYHLILSFSLEDELQLGADIFKEIEQNFANVLGFNEHQRICGVHKNTENIYMHIAYNMICKERYIRIEPFRDLVKRGRICRRMERDLGLSSVFNTEQEIQIEKKIASIATDFEVHGILLSL